MDRAIFHSSMSAGRLSKSIVHAGQKQNIARKVGPVSTLDMGRFKVLRGVSVADRKTHSNVLDKVRNFDQLRIHPVVKDHMASNLFKSQSMPPTPVQKIAIKALRKQSNLPSFRSWLIAAETGSGKTLSYLAPLLSNLIDNADVKPQSQTDEEISSPRHSRTHKRGPTIKSVILVPTVELAEQVADTAIKCMPSHSLDIGVFAGIQNSVQSLAKRVSQGVDIAIGTPDKLLKLCKENPTLMQHAMDSCTALVVDEADSLMNPSFEQSTSQLIEKCTELQDLIFVTATIPRSFDKLLRTRYPETRYLVTPSIHRLPRHIDFRVVEVWHRPYSNNKRLALQQALYSIYHDKTEEGRVKRVVVFVNLKRDVEPLVNMLQNSGYDATSLKQDRSNLPEFLRPQHSEEESSKMKVLVATDLVARGVDFHRVRNIILYDMPPNAADLLHRAGRTGRLGTKGRVLLFVSKNESKGWIRGLETIVKRGMALA